jgi:Protein of unknown function (DUF3780)
MPTERARTGTIGFGFTPAPKAAYHFVLSIPRGEEGVVTAAEHFTFGEDVAEAAARARFADEPLPYPIRPPQTKVEVSLYKWQRVAEEVRAEFNRRLRAAGMKASSWKAGENRLAPHLGKELVLLLWAIEDADPSLIPNAVANWQGLAPEERWWLYTTVNAATGHAADGRGRGWRKAIGIAFTDNPVVQGPYLSQSSAVPGSSPTPGSGEPDALGGRQEAEPTTKRRARPKKRRPDGDESSQLRLM